MQSNAEVIVDELGYRPFDCDNHYYEALDAFTRHLDPSLGERCIQWCEINGRKYQVVGGRVFRGVVNPTFDPVAPAGALHEYFRGNPEGRQPWEFLAARNPIDPAYRNREARLATMDAHGLEAIWLFPTLGMLYEEALAHDPTAVTLAFTAFNRWLAEDWGLGSQGRIFAGPYLSLADVDWACAELEWALDNGARVVVMRSAAPVTATGRKSPFDPTFDPFWARLNEAGIPLVIHAGDSGYSSNGYAEDSFSSSFAGGFGPSIKSFAIERAAGDFIITSLFSRLFERFGNLRLASVENGSGFLFDMVRKLNATHHKMPGFFAQNPVETLRQHWWINPFWEDDVAEVVDIMGAERVIFGSDWPHIEGMPEPLDYVAELKIFDDETRRLILRDNVAALNTPRPA